MRASQAYFWQARIATLIAQESPVKYVDATI
jgi:hypothetical protein